MPKNLTGREAELQDHRNMKGNCRVTLHQQETRGKGEAELHGAE